MAINVYKPPESEPLAETDNRSDEFYIVSKFKVSLLFLATFGMYMVYWFYINWRNYRDTMGSGLPALRSVFYLFFTHSLFNKVDEVLDRKKIAYQWSPGLLATLFVVLSLFASITEKIGTENTDFPFTLLSVATLPLILLVVLKAQGAINCSQEDPDGALNSSLTVYNYLWLLFGLVLWVFFVVDTLVSYKIISPL